VIEHWTSVDRDEWLTAAARLADDAESALLNYEDAISDPEGDGLPVSDDEPLLYSMAKALSSIANSLVAFQRGDGV
jgi:hypothetical protein